MNQDSVALRAAFGFLTVNELAFLKELAGLCGPRPIFANIGAGPGTSALGLVEAREDCTLFTIDIQDESNPFGSLEGERSAFHNAGLSDLYNRVWFQVHGDSKEVGQSWLTREWTSPTPDRRYPLDLVFVDGDHSYAGCSGDILAWSPLLKSGGIIAFHDYDASRGGELIWSEVDRAVQEGCLAHPNRYVQIGYVDTLVAFYHYPEASDGG